MSTTIKKNPPPIQPPPNNTVPDAQLKKESKSTDAAATSSITAPAPASTDALPATRSSLSGDFSTVEGQNQAARSSLLGDTAPAPGTTQSVRRDVSGGLEGATLSPSGASPRTRSVSLASAAPVAATTSAPPSGDPVNDVYRQTLGREPDAAGKQYWDQQVGQQRTQGKTDAEIGAFLDQRFRQSPEFQTREVAKQVYRDVLGREGDADGLRYWTEKGMEVRNAASTAPTQPPDGTQFATVHAPSMQEVSGGKVLEKGQGGPAVKEMQDRLTQLGFGVQQTGDFGPTTEGVVKDFQKAHNIQQTGKFGPTTLAALEKAEMAQRPDFSALKNKVGRGDVLGEGSKGAAVVDLQCLLSQRGFPTDADGSFGPNTSASVKKFQAANNIVQNGQVGPTTLKALQNAQGGGQILPGGTLNVPFYPQTDNYTMPDRTCNSSACAMAAKYLGANISGDDQYLRRVLQYGDTTDHSAQTSALNDYGIKSSFHYNLDFKDLDNALAQGKPVVIGINHRGPLHAPTGGHMITVIGKQGNDYIVHDPYGSLHDGYTGAVENGKAARYSRAELEARWTVDGPGTGWGRIFQ